MAVWKRGHTPAIAGVRPPVESLKTGDLTAGQGRPASSSVVAVAWGANCPFSRRNQPSVEDLGHTGPRPLGHGGSISAGVQRRGAVGQGAALEGGIAADHNRQLLPGDRRLRGKGSVAVAGGDPVLSGPRPLPERRRRHRDTSEKAAPEAAGDPAASYRACTASARVMGRDSTGVSGVPSCFSMVKLWSMASTTPSAVI